MNSQNLLFLELSWEVVGDAQVQHHCLIVEHRGLQPLLVLSVEYLLLLLLYRSLWLSQEAIAKIILEFAKRMLVGVQGYFIDLIENFVGLKVLEIVVWAIWSQALLYYVKDLRRLCFLAPVNGNVLQCNTAGDGPSHFGLEFLCRDFICVIS